MTYLEIAASDLKRAANFYHSVAGWDIEYRDNDDAPRFSSENAHLFGRWTTARLPHREAGMMTFFTVADVKTAFARAMELGGEEIAAPHMEGDVLLARLRDSEGNPIGIWQLVQQ